MTVQELDGARTAAGAPVGGSPSHAEAPGPRSLVLGKGWFPDQLGGLDRYYRDLLEHLPEARGIVVGRGATQPLRVAGVAGHDRPLAQRLLAFWRASQQAAGEAEVVDAHFALYAVAPLWVGRLRRKPAIVHFHGPWADENVAAGDGSSLRGHARRLLERAAYRRADHAVVLTSAFRQVLVERYGVAPWRVHVEPPGVDLVRFSPGSPERARARLGLAPDGFVAVTARRLVPRMGLDVLLDAWTAAAPRLPEGSTLLIVGDGPLRAPLAARIARDGLGESVRLLGRVADEELADLYRAADVGVVPSLEHEGFGLIVLEAAACGTPSIVTDVGGLPEAIADLDHSLIVHAGDPEALGERLLRARHDRPSRERTRAYAERFDWAGVAERHRSLLRRAAGREEQDDRLKVVYLDHVAQLSGGEIALLRLLPHLDRVHAHVVLAEDGPLVGQLHLAGVSTEVFPLGDRARGVRKGDVHGGGVSPLVAGATAAYVLRLARRLRQLRPDVVHTNSLKAGVYGSLAARLAGVPVVWHVRDRIAEDYLPAPAVKLVRAMTRRLATAVVANSRATMQTLVADLEPVVICSVLPEVMSAAAPRDRHEGGEMTYGIVGRLAPWKGQDLFLRAFAAAFPDGRERAVVVGAALFGEDEYARRLVGLAASLGIAGRVELRGFRSDVWSELARIDVLVHASVTPEPFGQVILEGMAAGVPVIAARAGGPAEILTHDVTGQLYEPDDAAALAAAMTRLHDPQLRARLSAAALEEVRRYEPGVVAAQLHELYDAVAARRHARR
jgi:glycosyltransferase involved in cell wall biosynthesis